MRKIALIILFSACFDTHVHAQTLLADSLRFNAGPCIITTSTPVIEVLLSDACAGITTQTSNLTLNPAGDLVTDPVGNDILPNLNYDINIGMLSKKYLTLHAAELWVETLVAQNTIATIGGRVLVAPTNILTSDLTTSSSSILVKYNNLSVGHRVYMEADGKVEFMAVLAGPTGAGPYIYNVQRDLDGSGSNQWYAGDAMLNTGTTGNGFIDLYSIAGVLGTGSGPTIVGNVRTGTTYNAYGPRWAIGNLNGLYGYGLTTYGSAFGDPSATNVTVDATNGFRIRSGTTNKFVADTAGNLSIVGDLTVGTAGVIRSGKTSCTVGTGWFMSYNAGVPQLCMGTPGGAGMVWDGVNMTLVGNIYALGGTIGGWTINSTTLTGGVTTLNSNGNITVGTGNNVVRLSDDATYRLWIGHATASLAPLRVTAAGAVTMTNAVIASGTVTINSSGITVDPGTGSGDGYKLEGPGIGMFYDTSVNVIYFKAPSGFNWERTGASLAYTSNGLLSNNSDNLGTSGLRWNTAFIGGGGINSTGDITTTSNLSTTDDLIVDRNFYFGGDFIWTAPSTTTADDYPLVYSTGTTIVYRKTDGFNGTCNSPTTIIIERGIITGCS